MTTRHYAEAGGRRVHYRRAGAGPPVVLLHESPRSSVALLPLLERLQGAFTVFALDTPGYGQSDPLPIRAPDVADYADGLVDALAAMGLGRAPVYGTHTGASIAFAFAARHPERCAGAVLDGFPVFSALEREEALASYLPPFRPSIDGTHLAWLWSRVRDQMLFFPWYRRGEAARRPFPLPSAEALQVVVMDMLRAGDLYRSAYAAAFADRPYAAFTGLRTPVVVGAREDDVLLGHLERLPPGLPECVGVARFPAEREAWGAALRSAFGRLAGGAAPAAGQAGLPRDRVGCAYLDLPHGQLHLRGALGGVGRPLLLLHPQPGGSVWFADRLARLAGRRPALAPDLPGSGDSDPADDVLDVLDAMLDRLGLTEVEIEGEGTGAVLAEALHGRGSGRRLGALVDPPAPGAVAPDPAAFAPHPAGAHLFAAWQHVRDEAILGPWTTRRARPFGTLDADLLHARTVEILKAGGNGMARP